jgi:hypothetical protein
MKPKIFLQALVITLLVLAVVVACKKTNGPLEKTEDATVVNAGDPAADGCGWQLRTADSTYSPVNLAAQYQTGGLSVRVTYHRTGTRSYCGFAVPQVNRGFAQIQIDNISKN